MKHSKPDWLDTFYNFMIVVFHIISFHFMLVL